MPTLLTEGDLREQFFVAEYLVPYDVDFADSGDPAFVNSQRDRNPVKVDGCNDSVHLCRVAAFCKIPFLDRLNQLFQ